MSSERPRIAEVTRNSGNPYHREPQLIGGRGMDPFAGTAIHVTAGSGGCNTIQAGADDDAFLRPVWHRGFWVMPPGGLTRYLIPSRVFINPDVTLAPGPGTVNSG